MGLAFDGWQRPGVMGASAAYRLATTYEALDSRTAVLVGSGTEALQIGNALLDAGVRIAAVVDGSQRTSLPFMFAAGRRRRYPRTRLAARDALRPLPR